MGRALAAIAPIAAGAMFPQFGMTMGLGSGIGAGALTGAGIAALTGDDPLMGAIGGGFGGYGGGGLRGAMDATKLASATPAATPAPFAGSPALSQAPVKGFSQVATAAPTTGQFTGQGLNTASGGGYDALTGYGGGITPTLSEGFQASLNDPGAFVNNLGGGSTAAGYGKLAMTAAPPLMELTAPEYEAYDETEDEYDPYSQLNLNMDTGIKAALEKDSGLRLYAEGGDVGGGVTGAGLAPGTPVAGAVSETISGPGGTESFSEMVASGMHPANAAAMLGMDPSPYLDMGPGMEFTGTPRTSPVSSGIGTLPPPPAPFTPEPGFDYEEYTGSYMEPMGRKTPVGIDSGAYGAKSFSPSPIGSIPYLLALREMTRKGKKMAVGGYLNGGALKGDGMSDDVPAMIDGSKKAALSQGEFVVPADVVSHLGNGSSDAGSKQLYGMMDKIRKARTGTEKQGKQINPERFMPS